MAASAPAITKFETKSAKSPDEVRTPSKTRVEVVHLSGFTLGRFTLDRGWRWSECIKPVVKTDLCQVSHVGYAVSGHLTLRLKDGGEKKISAGDFYAGTGYHQAGISSTRGGPSGQGGHLT